MWNDKKLNIYYLKDDYDYSITGIIITDKTQREVQNIINKAVLENEDSMYDDMLNALEKNDIEFINHKDIECVVW